MILFKSARNLFLLLASPFLFLSVSAEEVSQEYQMPPDVIADIIDAPPTPSLSISPDNETMLIIERRSLLTLEEVSQAELRIAGIRIDPATNGKSRIRHFKSLTLKNIDNLEETPITGLPDNPLIYNYSWSPDGRFIAFTLTEQAGIYLYLADIKNGQAKKLFDKKLNIAYGSAYRWLSDGEHIICRTIPDDRRELPTRPKVPTGPVVQENLGTKAPAATYADLLKDAHDEATLEYYLTSQIVKVDLDGKITNLGQPDLYTRAEPSPDGRYILTSRIHRPYSYLVRIYHFPHAIEILDMTGNIVRQVADQPLAEDIPTVSGSVRKGPRDFGWRDDQPATLYYVEALDDGDPRNDVEVRDQVYTLLSPFKGDPLPLTTTKLRYDKIDWCNEDIALLYEYWWTTRSYRVWAFSPGSAQVEPELIFDYSWQDRYNDPGDPLSVRNEYNRYVLQLDEKGTSLFLTGPGGSDEGDRPFLDKFDLESHQATRLWQSTAPYYESVSRVIDPKKKKVLIRRESVTEPPNYYLVELKNDKERQLTAFSHPAPQLKEVSKELIKYTRNDGLNLTGRLYLPPGYDKNDGPLPMLMWAYPEEFKSSDAAGQVKGSPYQFIRVGWWSPLLWLLRGYAVLDYPSMPIVGEGDTEPNDAFVEQLVANGQAAVDAVVELGVADRNRIAIGGHSYGAFMTANLLAHSDIYRAGIARTGAYNRTLTPFGFQNEERTFWEAPEIYFRMSPFMHADKINEPILLIHGDADNNPGTFPMQSERYYNALKGHGATCRLVMLPHESHSYRARENVMHVLFETDRWLEKYVKNAEEVKNKK